MSVSRAACSAIVAASIATLPLLAVHCGGGDDSASTGTKGDAAPVDGTSGDSTTASDSALDTSLGVDATADTNDTGAGDAPDGGDSGGDDAADAADAFDGFDGYTPGPPCDASDQCGDAGEQCCFGACSNVATDPHNCGACGNTCVTNQFCTGTACVGAVFSNLCANASGTVVLDEYVADQDAGSLMGAALAASCTPAVVVTAVSQDAGVANDPVTGRPIAGPGDTLVIAGGSYGQITMGYLDGAGLTRLNLAGDGANALAFFLRATNVAVVSAPISTLTASHDYFALELTVEPISGTLSYTGFGMYAPGTAAAAYYFSNVVMPNLAGYTNAWYVYEWTDSGDVDGGAALSPDSTDTFTLVMGGP
jgi:hypothetical protein